MNEAQHAALSYLREYLERSQARLEETQRVIAALDSVPSNSSHTWTLAKQCALVGQYGERHTCETIRVVLADNGYHTEES